MSTRELRHSAAWDCSHLRFIATCVSAAQSFPIEPHCRNQRTKEPACETAYCSVFGKATVWASAWPVKNLLLTNVYVPFELGHVCSPLRSVGYDCFVFPGTPSTLRGWKPRLATRSRRQSHAACTPPSLPRWSLRLGQQRARQPDSLPPGQARWKAA